MKFRFLTHPLFITFIVLLIDQGLKIWVKTNMMLGDDIPIIGDWFIIHFIENPGMAFGMEFGGEYGKLALSLFRIVAVTGIGYVLFTLPKTAPTGLKICGALVFAGALGNIIDSAFYGIIFNESFNQIATFLPEEGGYAPFLHGWVVDMFSFPLFKGVFPEWFPIWGGEDFLFFRPVFNVADASISVGISLIFIFQKRFFKKEEAIESTTNVEAPSEPEVE
ncbi:MAG: lipoprotein signal peptidase [Flavobacteriales bacterium CG18_big_fil_WC_8_21_14_2_50_32_9]|nr:lipoprotein signal peptidase [Flavobacteriales bacterium]PIQ16265.1 MAG: lipoprotein signal peptidase [Flavobacteriales bacterium CG18_big_fil_WC_8_21_14_2_50_32_9]PJC61498.1 MAG: lipoprotein signal peptidase [Flavobacteriales bacterium CG_4_9_14_0_2_um_filter_32_27]